MKEYLLSCDWGTTSFRLRLVNRIDHAIAGEVISQNGVNQTYNIWKERESGSISRKAFFIQQLKEHVTKLSGQVNIDFPNKGLDGIPIVLSGMVSSSIGMQEIPYAHIPFELSGSNVLVHHIEAQKDFPHEIMLISGVRSNHDVMRGEETQLIGLDHLAGLGSPKEAIFIFPGTHSKHMYVKNGQLDDFKTFMTGEVFNLMANHSILKDSVELHAQSDFRDEAWHSFKEGIRESASGFILNSLFTVRTNQLFDLLNKKQNAMYLSGLLIGSEIRYLTGKGNWQLVLCSGNNLFDLYKTAIEELQMSDRTINVPSEIIDKAATAGHIRIFEHQKLTLYKTNYE